MPFTPPSVDPNLYPDWQSWARQLLKYLQQTSDEQAASVGYQLSGHASTNLPSAATDGTIIYKTDTEYVSAAFSDTWYDLAMTAKANVFTATQTIELTNESATAGPDLVLVRRSASPTTADELGRVVFKGNTSEGNLHEYATILGLAEIVSDELNSRGAIYFYTRQIGSATVLAFRAGIGPGLVVGSASFTGFGTVNIEGSYYVDAVQVVSNRRTGWTAATGTPTRTTFDTATVTLPQLAERVKALIDDAISHGLIGS